ncbi:1-phosphatidylinositol 4,5-bisphosphate phosphodiesterase gamma-1-like [Uloborus diversus]|uniref:1-phosphatidylinositol 4,5-bisphosphate phosphodiesterase gamma-1-like n=1 Tax=Uloborus diversus TaxID=327109 RepID=UPI00240A24C7|nr:1-phosphatidylinositol 4,5-bisphosphate phosphodiesterase gamma-1-like [Uloborus diversus]
MASSSIGEPVIEESSSLSETDLQNLKGKANFCKLEQIYQKFEYGYYLEKLYVKQKPERRTFLVKLETRQIIWFRPRSNVVEGSVDLREVKEIRGRKSGKLFERWQDETKRYKKNCEFFVVLYGNTFCLKELACIAKRDQHEILVRGLQYLVAENDNVPYPLEIERWLKKEFFIMKNSKELIPIKDLKQFLLKINLKLPGNRLKEIFQKIDVRRVGEIGFESFASFYHNLMYSGLLLSSFFYLYTKDDELVSLEEFQDFLHEQQKDPNAYDEAKTIKLMCDFLQNPGRDAREPFFTIPEFLDFLFSKQNDVFDPSYSVVNQDMNHSLVNYWIATSHNTYLTGDQLFSKSSTEAYARCLRMGCRCIELDCWDGPDGLPYVYHGRTLTTKVKFIDCIRTIKEHAFVTSEYPVILSVENHTSLPQQRNMATAFVEIFGDLLLTQPIEKDGTQMPTPNQLKKKVIIKHKKLPEKEESEDKTALLSEREEESDINNAVKNGILYLEGPVNREWRPHFFMLTQSKMYYAEEEQTTEDEDDDEGINTPIEDIPSDELHYGEKWFHGRLRGGGAQAGELLNQYSYLGDGTFLVRESVTYPGDYSLSFWHQGTVNHCHISKQEDGQTQYYINDSISFDSLHELVTYFQANELITSTFSICLAEPVPQPKEHEGKEWYHANMTRSQATELLMKIHYDGAFLVRPSEKQSDAIFFAISFRAENKVKHCRIEFVGRLYSIGSVKFESLVQLVNYYEKNTLYRKVKLKYPVSEEVLQRMSGMNGNGSCHLLQSNASHSSYLKLSFRKLKTFKGKSMITVKALHEYHAQSRCELSFPKHAVITNVSKEDGGWWKGDFRGKKQHFFPSIYVEEIELIEICEENASEAMPLGDLQKGSIDIVNCTVDSLPSASLEDQFYVFRISSPHRIPIEIAATSEDEMREWTQKIRETSQSANDMLQHSRKMEKTLKIAKELSNLIVYCKTISYNPEKVGNFAEMYSFSETKIEKLIGPTICKQLLKYHKLQFSRVYPKASRVDSSNFDPIKHWNCGVQMAALNYQTPDKAMQLNQARFLQNGRCGYVLKPSFMLDEAFDPYDKTTLQGVKPIVVTLEIIAARHLMKFTKGIISPFFEIEIVGAEYDCNRFKTTTKEDNGFNPVWKESFTFIIYNKDLALIRFVAQYIDVFGDSNFLAQTSYPVNCLRAGYRSVALKNEYSEELELASLLIHISIEEFELSLAQNQQSSEQSENVVPRAKAGNSIGEKLRRSLNLQRFSAKETP